MAAALFCEHTSYDPPGFLIRASFSSAIQRSGALRSRRFYALSSGNYRLKLRPARIMKGIIGIRIHPGAVTLSDQQTCVQSFGAIPFWVMVARVQPQRPHERAAASAPGTFLPRRLLFVALGIHNAFGGITDSQPSWVKSQHFIDGCDNSILIFRDDDPIQRSLSWL